ncbi:MAG: DUF4349 domain-containing protein [Clostridia bacterium]|nr:DUF4349 domain-containing protein [Clostridia bacterium]
MKCKTFQANLDAYIDSELDADTRKAMEKHAAQCEDCARLLDNALTLAGICAEMNEGLEMPKACKAAWREAIHQQNDMRSRRERRHSSRRNMFVRAASALAAVLVLAMAVGSQTDLSELVSNSRGAGYSKSASVSAYDGGAYSGGLEYALSSYESVPVSGRGEGVTLQSDGSAGTDLSVGTAAQASNVMIIRSAVRAIRTANFDSDQLIVNDLVSEYGAYYESKRISGQSQRQMDAVIRVPSDALDRFLSAIDVVGTVTVREDRADDVTDEYVDITARLNVLRAELEQLNAMNDSAANVSELIEISERASAVTAEIESYESRMKSIESRQNYSTVTLTLSEYAQVSDMPEATLTDRMKEAFSDSLEWLRNFGKDAAVFAAALAPRLVIWIPVAIIVIILLKIAFGRRKRRNKGN